MAHHGHEEPKPHATLAEFDSPEQLMEATKKARAEGFTELDAYTPYPVHGLIETIGYKDTRVPFGVFLGGAAGAIGGLALEWWVSVYAYPHNVGGKPLFSLPMFFPVFYECTILLASFAAVFGMLGLNGLPRPHHPVFDASHFDRASQDKFFLAVEAKDPLYDSKKVRAFLEKLGAGSVEEVMA